MNVSKPVPISKVPARNRCTVCGEVSYSLTGTHPQCAAKRADAVRQAARKASAPVVERPARKPWSKSCPKCKREIPSRRFICDCGHQFEATAGGQPVVNDAGIARRQKAR